MKRFFCLMTLLLLTSVSNAQTVLKVNGSEALIDLKGNEKLEVGNSVHFLDESLAVTGTGKVLKISAGGSKALIKIEAGKIKQGMTLENESVKKPAAETERKSEGVTYAHLSESEREVLSRGEVSETQYIVGGIIGTYPGLGIGHAIQGRYSEKGWIFTTGEIATLVAFASGIGDCWNGNRYGSCNSGLALGGLIGYLGFRVWEIVDVWSGPREQNRRYREIRNMLERESMSFQPILVPTKGGGMFGLNINF
ncbi:MAG: hypothetical protein ACXVCP_07845 [Bdellovibrio sp.]